MSAVTERHRMEPRALSRLVVRVGVAYALLAALAVTGEERLNRAMAPGVQVAMTLFHPGVRLQTLSCKQNRLTARVVFDYVDLAGKRPLSARVAANGDQMLVGPLLALSLVLAWQFRSRRGKVAALVIAAALASALSAYDMSSAIAFGIESKLGETTGPSRFVSFFFDSGGRQLLALAAAAAAVCVVRGIGIPCVASETAAPSTR